MLGLLRIKQYERERAEAQLEIDNLKDQLSEARRALAELRVKFSERVRDLSEEREVLAKLNQRVHRLEAGR